MSLASERLYNALIRTHHITSRKKVGVLKKAAHTHSCYVVIRYGGCPGIMYCEGTENGVRQWLAAAQGLRYKDYKLAARLAPFAGPTSPRDPEEHGMFREVGSVRDFGAQMEEWGIHRWWRKAMGYTATEG